MNAGQFRTCTHVTDLLRISLTLSPAIKPQHKPTRDPVTTNQVSVDIRRFFHFFGGILLELPLGSKHLWPRDTVLETRRGAIWTVKAVKESCKEICCFWGLQFSHNSRGSIQGTLNKRHEISAKNGLVLKFLTVWLMVCTKRHKYVRARPA